MKEKKSPKVEKVLSKELMVDEQTWLVQPVAVTTMSYDYDLVQTRVLVAVVDKLQDSIRSLIANGTDVRVQMLGKFNASDIGVTPDDIVISIPMKDFGMDKKQYNLLKRALGALVTVPVSIPVKDKEGNRYEHFTSFCQALLPKENYGREVFVIIKSNVAKLMLDVNTFGFHKYLKEVVFTSRSKYTQRIYMYISSWKNKGHTPPIQISKLRQMLLLENKMKGWAMFNSRVIETARLELEEKAKNGEADCFFEPEFVYPAGKRRGEPSAIIFHIEKTSSLSDSSIDKELSEKKKSLARRLKVDFSQTFNNRKDILSVVDDENILSLTSFLDNLEKIMDSRKGQIKNICSWAYSSIMQELKRVQGLRECPDLFSSVENQKEKMSGKSWMEDLKLIPQKEPDIILDENKEKCWKNVLNSIKERVGDTEYLWMNENTRFCGLREGRPMFMMKEEKYIGGGITELSFFHILRQACFEYFEYGAMPISCKWI